MGAGGAALQSPAPDLRSGAGAARSIHPATGGVGDSGLLLADGATRRELAADIKMLGKAIKERWPIEDQWREGIATKLAFLALEPEPDETTPKEKIQLRNLALTAIRLLFLADSQNLAQELRANPKKILHAHAHAHAHAAIDPHDQRAGLLAAIAAELHKRFIPGLGYDREDQPGVESEVIVEAVDG